MEKTVYKDLEKEKRAGILRDNADGTETFSYTRKFTDEELIEKRAELSEVTISINDIMVEKKEVNSQFAEQLKPLELQKVKLITDVKHKSTLVTEEVFLIANREEGIMDFINDSGEVVHSRRLTDKEKQLTIFSLPIAVNE